MKRFCKCFLLFLVLALALCACSKPAEAPTTPTWQEQYDLGIRYLAEGNYQEAIIAFNAAIEIDPRSADAYIALADAYNAMADTDAAVDALQRGYDETGDERFRGLLDALSLPKELWVLTRQEAYLEDANNIYYGQGSELIFTETYDYNPDGYCIESNRVYTYDPEKPDAWVDRWEYNENEQTWKFWQSPEGSDERYGEREQPIRERGVSGASYTRGIQNFEMSPLPQGDHPARVENSSPRPGDNDAYQEDWAYAEYEYDQNGNATSVTSYGAGGNLLGRCLFEWNLLILGPDGKYTVQ